MAFGIIGSSAMQMGTQVSLVRGEAMDIGSYTITYQGLEAREDTPLVDAVSATLSITNSGKDAGFMVAEKYFHENFTDQYGDVQPVTEVAIRSSWREDLYVILAGWDDSGATAAFEIFVNPAIMWIWIGGGFLSLGGVIALWGPRRPAVSVPAVEDGAALEDEIEKEIMQLRQAGDRHGGSTCSECGARYPEGGLFCPQCGTKVG
jgi:cytochrome c-type biogenesis protein CcmF